MAPRIINFKMSTVIQPVNKCVLPELKGGVLVLAVKARLGPKQLERLNKFVPPEGMLGTGRAAFTVDLKLADLLDDVIDFGRLGWIALAVTPWHRPMRRTE